MDVNTLLQRPAMSGAAILGLTLLVRFVVQLVSHRRYIRKLQAQGLPMPPHSFLFGHLPIMIRITNSLPSDAHPTHLPYFIQQSYNLGPNFYLDLWPLSPSILLAGSPEMVHQVSTKYLDKNDLLKNFLHPLTDGLDIVSLNGTPWKKWRSIFNPGFSLTQLMKLVPNIVENSKIYCDQLDKHVTKQDIFEMKSLTDNLIIDVIGQVVLGVDFHSQTTSNPIIHSLRTQIKWMTTGTDNNLLNRYNPLRPLVQWYHGRIVTRYVSKELDQSIDAWQKKSYESDSDHSRTITDLALQAYAESQPEKKDAVLDPHFKKVCSSQIKIFLFAGHDTTSSGICFNLWLLSQNPSALARMRQEHTDVFGSDESKAAEMMVDSPHLLSKLHYTTAIIKESLRLFTPVTSTRKGDKGNIIDSQGRIYPTEDFILWMNQYSIHRDPAYWTSATTFMPERWLADAEDSLHPIKGMWRPFEQGPRSCLGLELAMIEMKIALVLVSRTYVFKPAYDELDKKAGRSQTVLGVQAYQTDIMQPRGNLPVRVDRIMKG